MLGTLHTGNHPSQVGLGHALNRTIKKNRCRKWTSRLIQDDAQSSGVPKLSQQHKRAAAPVLKPQRPTFPGIPEEDQARYMALTKQGTCRQHREGFVKEGRE